MQTKPIIVIGGGLAGLSAAFELTEQKKEVILLESRHVLGGRTSSWTDKGMKVESGLHRFLGFYNALPELLTRAGIDLDAMLFWEDEIEILLPDGGPRGIFGASPIHKPLKTLKNIVGNNDLINAKDKLSLSAFFTAGLKDYATTPDELDQQNVLDYAKEKGVTKEAIEHILIPFTSGIFFLPPERYSMYALMGLMGPYLPSLAKTRIGAFQGGMTEVMCDPIAKAIKERGGKIYTDEPVTNLLVKDKSLVGIKTKTKTWETDQVILATSLKPAQTLLQDAAPDWFEEMLKLPSMPAVTIQFELTERSMEFDRTTFGPTTSWASFAEQNQSTFKHVPGRLSVILTPADEVIEMTDKDIFALAIKDGKRLGIDIEKKIKDFRITRIPHDFYSLSPGNEHLRPQQKTPIYGLTLAGDYTKQPNLATMEGAVVSGKLAAANVLQ